MKSKFLLLLPLMAAFSSFAADTGPRVTGNFRIVKQDGNTVIQQAAVSDGSSGINTITISGSEAFMSGAGRCAFNVKYDEISAKAATGTTNRIFSNDALIAQNTKIDLQPNVLKTIWTQPYLVPGMNYVRLGINADAAKPSTGWVRVNVTGNCGGVTATPPQTTPPKTEPSPNMRAPPRAMSSSSRAVFMRS